MRAILVTLAMLLAVMVGWAAPGRQAPVPTPADDQAHRFGLELYASLEQIGDSYYRPLSREKLYETAIAGIYRAGRKPVPRSLKDSIEKAVVEAGPKPYEQKPPPVVEPRQQLLIQAFQQSGLTHEAATLAAYRALATQLDPHSGIVTAEQQRRNVGLDYAGLGLGLELRGAIVECVHPGGPAQRAGLFPGDVLLRVDNHPFEKMPSAVAALLQTDRVYDGPRQISEQMMPEAAPALRLVRLRYRRAGQPEREVEVLRERFRPETVMGVRRRDNNSWEYFVNEKERVAHVRLGALSRGTGQDLRDVLEVLHEQGMRGLVLDLRWCPGGYLNEAVDIAGLFLGDEAVATIKGRGRQDVVYRGTGEQRYKNLPLVVLVNHETSGGAELIAAALQDHKRARIVGQRTLGKASVQTPLSTGVEGVGFKLTTGTFVRPSGKNLHRFPESQSSDDWGVVPDEDCRVSPALAAKLKRDWLLWSLRPARAMQRLALDDPLADSQQQAALREAQRLMDATPRLTRGR